MHRWVSYAFDLSVGSKYNLNVLDLGLFRAIQALLQQKFVKNTKELVKAVKEAYDEYNLKNALH